MGFKPDKINNIYHYYSLKANNNDRCGYFYPRNSLHPLTGSFI